MKDEKIFEDEIMSEEELDGVAGGMRTDTSLDSHLLYDYGLINDYYSKYSLIVDWVGKSAKVDSGWAKVGITSVTNYSNFNEYYAGSKQISREEAVKILKSKFYRKHYTYSDDDGVGNP